MVSKDFLSDKSFTSISDFSLPVVPERDVFVKVRDFEKSVLLVVFSSLVFCLGVLLL